MFRVYKITNNITGKLYVGYTGYTITRRFERHCSEPRDTIISRSIRKYGRENFAIQQLFEFVDETTAKAKEIELIAEWQLNVHRYPNGNGMNMTDGGEGARGYKHTEDMRAEFSRMRKGKNTGPRPSTTGRLQKNSKTVYVFTTGGEFVIECKTVSAASAFIGVDSSSVHRCCKGELRTAGGYVCQWTSEFSPPLLSERPDNSGRKNGRSRVCYMHTDTTTVEFGSLGEAARYLDVPYSTTKSAVRSNIGYIQSRGVYISYDATRPSALIKQCGSSKCG